MIAQEYKVITVHTDNDGDEICLRIQDDDQIGGILNLCWLNEKETDKLITELMIQRRRMIDKRERMEKLIRTMPFDKLYGKFEEKYNPYPAQMSRCSAFSKAYADGLISRDIYYAAEKYYGNLWCYVGD